MPAFIMECFKTISWMPTPILKRQFISNGSQIRILFGQLISSPKANARYLFISCLLELDAVLWAGIAEDIPPMFDESQVHVIMGFLDSSDVIIRVKVRECYKARIISLWIVLSDLASLEPGQQRHSSNAFNTIDLCSRWVNSHREGLEGKSGREGA
jgi:hypothetical protein